MLKKIILGTISVIGLIYLILPGPTSINDIAPLPDSVKSKEPGDTTQNPNNAAYFSNMRRKAVTDFYAEMFGYLNFFGIKIPPIRLNHPPEEAFTYIRDQQSSTYLEQFVYPLRDSLYVNGFEPFDENGNAYRRGATNIFIEGNYYTGKNTLRYFSSPVAWRVLVYIGIWVSLIALYKLSKKVLFEKV